MSINESIERQIRHMSSQALRSLAARANRHAWRRMLDAIRVEFTRRKEAGHA